MQGHLKLGLSRRHFLFAGAAAGGGMLIGWAPIAKAETNNFSRLAPGAFIRIDRQNRVTIVSPMIEMGQGTYTALPMLVADIRDGGWLRHMGRHAGSDESSESRSERARAQRRSGASPQPSARRRLRQKA